jgi:hypothetical protein
MQEFLELIMMLVGWIMRLAPFGIMALVLQLVATQDTGLLTVIDQVCGGCIRHHAVARCSRAAINPLSDDRRHTAINSGWVGVKH